MGAGPTVSISAELQDDFSIHHSLSLFLIHAVGRLNQVRDFSCDSIVHGSRIGGSSIVLLRQQDGLRRDAYASMKAEGIDYDERQDRLEKSHGRCRMVTVFEAFDDYVKARPWLAQAELGQISGPRHV